MPCSQTLSGLARECGVNLGGIKEVYLANFDDVASVTITSNLITAITMNGTPAKKFYAYVFNPNTSNFTTTIQANRENGSLYFETVLSLVFAKQDATKRVEVNALAQAGMMAIVRDANDVCYLLGYNEPLLMTSGTAETGTAKADRNGYALEFTDAQMQMPYMLDPSDADTIISGLL